MSIAARRAAAALAAAGTVMLPGCGDEGSTTTVTTGTPGTKRVVVEAQAGGFHPAAIYAEAAPGVVTIRSRLGESASVLGGGGGAQGSGFVISGDGEIATNAHVVTDGEATGGGQIREAKAVYVQFADHNQVPAEIVGFDPHADVALLHVDPAGLELHPLELGSSEDVQVGGPVAAIGSPFGEDRSLSVGVISATDRSIDSLTDFRIDGAIQTDASINPGNSGGPLLDGEARVIGINQQINTTSGGNEGVGFAVPIDLVRRSLDALREDGKVEYAYLGVQSQPLYPQLAERLHISSETGALISKVFADGPADDAGLEASDERIRFQGQPYRIGGDVIVAVNDHPISEPGDLSAVISRLDPGDTATLSVVRDGDARSVEVVLGTRPS